MRRSRCKWHLTKLVAHAAIALGLASMSFAAPPEFKPPQKLNSMDALRPGQSAFDVTPTGEAVWSMPIWIPPGRHGIEPHLSIIYRSESGDGLLGERFGIGGLLSVSRCWSTPSQDGHYSTGSSPGLPDQFCLDGERLVQRPDSPIGDMQPEFDPSVYVTEIGLLGDPVYFIARYSDGRTAQFGSRDSGFADSSQSRVRGHPIFTPIQTDAAAPPQKTLSQAQQTLRWNVDRIVDRWGNYLDIDYERTVDGGVTGAIEVVPKEIRWTGYFPPSGNAGLAAAPSRRMRFIYQDSAKLDGKIGYRAGIAVKQSKLLQTIQILAKDGLVSDPDIRSNLIPLAKRNHIHVKTERVFREYRFSYVAQSPSFRALDRLGSIQECVYDTAVSYGCLNPTSFGWSESPSIPSFYIGDGIGTGGNDFPIINEGSTNGVPNPVGFVYDVYESVVGDFNGDGRSDILYRVPAMNLDGTCQKVTESTASFVLPTPSTCFGVWNLRLGTDTGLGPRMSVPGIPASPGGDWIYTPRVLDIDGDGKDEILLFTDPGVQVYGLSDCSTSHCDFAPVATISTYANFGLDAYKGLLSQSSPVQIADLNGDGLVDVIGEEPVASQSQATNLYFSAGDRPPEGPFYPYGSFGSTRTLLVPTTSPNALSPIHTMIGDERFVVDIDGNGQYEFLTPVYNSNQSPVTLSAVHISSDPSASSQLTATTLAVAQTDACHHTSRFFFDFNGDGLVDSLTLTSPNDLVGCAGELTTASVAVNSGSAFRAATALPLSSDAQPPPRWRLITSRQTTAILSIFNDFPDCMTRAFASPISTGMGGQM